VDDAPSIVGTKHLAEQLETVHLHLDQAAAMVAAPSLPDRPTKPLDCAGCLAASTDARSTGLPWLTIAADRNDRVGTPCCNRRTVLPGGIGAVTADDRNALVRRNLCQKIRRRRRVTNRVDGDLDRPDR